MTEASSTHVPGIGLQKISRTPHSKTALVQHVCVTNRDYLLTSALYLIRCG